MYGTKRKFHNLLNSITNSSSTSLPPSNASTDSITAEDLDATKKRKLTRPRSFHENAIDRISKAGGSRPNTSGSASASIAAKLEALKAKEKESTEASKAPNFAPWSRDHFLKRLITYRRVVVWGLKPDAINEVEWARRGWSCSGYERVRCVGGCEKEVYIKLDADQKDWTGVEEDKENEAVVEKYVEGEHDRDQLVHRYAQMIITEHDEGCLWRIRGCDGK
jgi:C3HC zinc finger-like